MLVSKIFRVFILVIFSSCSIAPLLQKIGIAKTSYNVDFKDKLSGGGKIYVARVHILRNGKDITSKCAVLFNGRWDGPVINLKDGGDLYWASNNNPQEVIHVVCWLEKFVERFYEFNNIIVRNKKNKNIIYVGDWLLNIDSQNKQSYKTEGKYRHGEELRFDEKFRSVIRTNAATITRFEKKFNLKVTGSELINVSNQNDN